MTARANPSGPLAGLGILVTRPVHQADTLSAMIEAAGGIALRLPAIEIQGTVGPAETPHWLEELKSMDMAIFLSANAVRHGLAALNQAGRRLPANITVTAIGPSTADALMAAGIHIDIVPARAFTSEALLAEPKLQDMAERQLMIFRGEGGRELLAQTLRERGAVVRYAQVYRRVPPTLPRQTVKTILRSSALRLVTVSSSEGLENLCRIAAAAGVTRLHELPLLVGSRRMHAGAERLGFHSILEAPDPSDHAMFEAIQRWGKQRKSTA